MRYAIENILSIHRMTRAGSRPSLILHDPARRASTILGQARDRPLANAIHDHLFNPFGVSRFEKCYRLSRARPAFFCRVASRRPPGFQMSGLSLGFSYPLLAPRSPRRTSGEENYATAIRCITFQRSIDIAGWTHSVLELLTVGYSCRIAITTLNLCYVTIIALRVQQIKRVIPENLRTCFFVKHF